MENVTIITLKLSHFIIFIEVCAADHAARFLIILNIRACYRAKVALLEIVHGAVSSFFPLRSDPFRTFWVIHKVELLVAEVLLSSHSNEMWPHSDDTYSDRAGADVREHVQVSHHDINCGYLEKACEACFFRSSLILLSLVTINRDSAPDHDACQE